MRICLLSYLFHSIFKDIFFNKIPLLKKLGWRENVYFRTAVGSVRDDNKNYFRAPNELSSIEDIYAETGFGISNVFKFFEVHSIWRLTQHDKSTTRKWGVLVGAFFEL